MPPSSVADNAWLRLARGNDTLLLGDRSPAAPAAGIALVPLRLDCAHHRGALGFVRDAVHAVGRLLGSAPSRWLPTPSELRSDAGLRRRLLEESPTRAWGGALVAALRDLARQSRGRAVLVLEGIDEASDEVAAVLMSLLERSQLLRMPVLMTSAAADPAGRTARELVERFLAREGVDAVLRSAPEGAPEPRSGADARSPDRSRAIPAEVLRILRALAVASPDAPVEALAALLDLDAIRVLESLQSARDLGVDIRERGDGRLSLAPETAETLAASLMPSLVRAYHRRLAAWHGHEVEPAPEPGQPPRRELPLEPPAPEAEPRRAPRTEQAASHAEAAGEPQLAAAQYTRALQEAAALDLAPQALEYGRKALALIERLPESERRRGLHVDVLAALAFVHWQAAGTDADVSLDGACDLLDRATDLLRESDPPSAAAELDALRAQILYDVGSREALEQALGAVTRASRAWQEQGKPVRAARLLNDAAAIWVRLGDPRRAHRLLTKSLELFGRMARDDDTARLEEAETRHLLARLLFHVDAKPGREVDAVDVALDHARAAGRIYTELDQPRDAARTRETLGRLAQLLGDTEQAEADLLAAAAAQQEHADPLGLARTTAALAELCAARGDAAGCLDLLGRSVELNASSGSPLGLAYNRRALESLAPELEPEAAASVDTLFARLEQAEGLVGRTRLPD